MFGWALQCSSDHWRGSFYFREWVLLTGRWVFEWAGSGWWPGQAPHPQAAPCYTHMLIADAALLLHQTPPISCSYHIKSFPQAVPCLSRRFSVHRPVCDDRCVAATKTIACSNCRLLDKYSRFKLVLPFSCFSLHVFVCISPFCCEPRSGSLHNWSL